MSDQNYRDTLDEISRQRYDSAMRKADEADRAAAEPEPGEWRGVVRKNEIVDAVGFGRLSESDLSAFAGIEGSADDARIYNDLEIFGGVQAVLVLCDEHLGLTYCDENDNLHGFQVSGVARLVRELIARELVEWHTRHPGVEISEHALGGLGFELCF